MGLGHVPQEPFRAEGAHSHVQRRERRRAARRRDAGLLEIGENSNAQFGAWGEECATQWYVANGFDIVARNWRHRRGELDIIAVRDRLLVVCEVKTRSRIDYGVPAFAVNAAKQQRIRRLAAAFLSENPMRGVVVRFDVAEVVGHSDDFAINVISSAF